MNICPNSVFLPKELANIFYRVKETQKYQLKELSLRYQQSSQARILNGGQ